MNFEPILYTFLNKKCITFNLLFTLSLSFLKSLSHIYGIIGWKEGSRKVANEYETMKKIEMRKEV